MLLDAGADGEVENVLGGTPADIAQFDARVEVRPVWSTLFVLSYGC